MDVPPIIYAALIIAGTMLLAALIRTFGENPLAPGRFQFNSGPGGECRVLDTRTGKLWERAAGSTEWVTGEVPWRPQKGKG